MSSNICMRHPSNVQIGVCPQCGSGFCSDCRSEDTATGHLFCSTECRSRAGILTPQNPISEEELLRAKQSPIRVGWILCCRALPALLLKVLPIALAFGVLIAASR